MEYLKEVFHQIYYICNWLLPDELTQHVNARKFLEISTVSHACVK